MRLITVDRDPDYAPCCFLICAVNNHDHGYNTRNEKETILVEVDYSYPGLATSFGWDHGNIQQESGGDCPHLGTDGTIDCPDCKATASQFIDSARQFLDDNRGKIITDPGYFESN